MGKNKEKIYLLIFSKKYFGKAKIKNWIVKNDFIIDNRFKNPIVKCEKGNHFRVRQRNPDWFNKKTFISKSLGNGVKGIYGSLKRR